jgi:hypothetical protein
MKLAKEAQAAPASSRFVRTVRYDPHGVTGHEEGRLQRVENKIRKHRSGGRNGSHAKFILVQRIPYFLDSLRTFGSTLKSPRGDSLVSASPHRPDPDSVQFPAHVG